MSQSPVAFESDHFSLYQLAEGVYAAIAADGGSAISNAGIIDLGERTLVFDTFMTPEAGSDLRVAARRVTGREPDIVVNSHYHNDHIWGNQAFDPATLFITTAATLELMRTDGQEEVKWARDVSARRLEEAQRQLAIASNAQQRREAGNWIGYFGGLVKALPDLSVRFPDVTFTDRLTMHGSAHSVELIPYRNCHCGNDLILVLKDSGIAFMADLLFVNCHPYLEEGDTSQLRKALEGAAGLGATVFVPGHGPLGAMRDIESNIAYIDMCVETARKAIASGDASPEGLASRTAPEPFAAWGLSRFFTINLQSLCAKITAGELQG